MTNIFSPELLERITENAAEYLRPLLFTGARIHVFDSLVQDTAAGDVLLGDGFIVGTGPGIQTAAGDDNALVIDCTGMVIVPAVVDTLTGLGLRDGRSSDVGTLWPGNAATFAIIPAEHASDAATAVATLLGRPHLVAAILVDGKVVHWNGQCTMTAPTRPDHVPGVAAPSNSPYVGMRIDESDFLHQELAANGRYDETRGGRPHAFQGAFWIDGDRIDYLDDLGFWAFGQFKEGTLHHGPYILNRR